MKVLIINGSILYIYELALGLYNQGIDVSIIIFKENYNKLFYDNRIKILPILESKDTYFNIINKIKNYIKKEGFDILHFHSTFSPRRDWLFLPNLFKNFIYTAHNIIPHEVAFGEVLSLRIFYNRLSKIIVHGKRNKEELINRFGVSDNKIYIIPHGAFTFYKRFVQDITKEEARLKLGLPLDKKILLFFGVIRKIKGLEYLFFAYRELLKDFRDVFLAVCGMPLGVSIERYKRLIDKLNIKDKLYFNPNFIPIEDVGLYFKSADLVVLPYIRITDSGVAKTAISFGLPIVASDVGALNETVIDNKNGFLVKPKDIEGLKFAIYRILKDKDLAVSMSDFSLKLTKEFNWDNIAKKTIEVYKNG